MVRESWELIDMLEGAGYACYCVFDHEVQRASECVVRHAKKHHHRFKTWLASHV